MGGPRISDRPRVQGHVPQDLAKAVTTGTRPSKVRTSLARDRFSLDDWAAFNRLTCPACRFVAKVLAIDRKCAMCNPNSEWNLSRQSGNDSVNKPKPVALTRTPEYTRPNAELQPTNRRSKNMAPRGRAAVVEPEEDELDLTVYADKEPTHTMLHFANWIKDEVYEGDLGDLDED